MPTNQSGVVVSDAIKEKIESNNLLLLGESHDMNADNMNHIANYASEFASQGVTTLVLEKFKTSSDPNDPLNDQAILDAFYAKPPKVLPRLIKKCATSDGRNGVPIGTLLNNLVKLRDAGIKVVPGEDLKYCRNEEGQIDGFSQRRFNGFSVHVHKTAKESIARGGKVIVISGLSHNYDVDPQSLSDQTPNPQNYTQGILSKCQQDKVLANTTGCINIVSSKSDLALCKQNVANPMSIEQDTCIIGGKLYQPQTNTSSAISKQKQNLNSLERNEGNIYRYTKKHLIYGNKEIEGRERVGQPFTKLAPC